MLSKCLQVFLSLLFVIHQVSSLQDQHEHSSSNLHRELHPEGQGLLPWPVPTDGNATSKLDEKLGHGATSNHMNHGQSLIKPANNKILASKSQIHHQPRLTPIQWHHLDTGDSMDLALEQQVLNHRHQQHRNQQQANLQLSHFPDHHAALAGASSPYQHQHQPAANANAGGDQSSHLNSLPNNLELALRQASSDESVFHPSPAINIPGHSSFDWLTQGLPAAKNQMTTERRSGSTHHSFEYLKEKAPETTSTAATSTLSPTTTTTTELSNNVSNQVEPLVLNQQQSREHQLQLSQSSVAIASSPIEFNNQVIYEGPATAPPPSTDDFYSPPTGSHLDRLPPGEANSNNQNNVHSNSNAWWAIGVGAEFERASNLTRDEHLAYCDKSPLLINNKQRSLCRMHHRVMPVVARGLKLAIDECQARFASSRWNCSVILQDALDRPGQPQEGERARQVFGDVMRHPNRERSFLNAIFAAGLAHAMTKACSQGELPEECSCDRKIKSKNNKGRVEWVACSDDIDYGARFSRDFTDNFDSSEPDATTTIYMHNSEVGRRVFKSATDITCTCSNGENGMCQTKRCWKHLGAFSDVVDEIMRRYEGATHVQRSNKDPHKLRPVRRGVRRPKRKDLVYIDESPDYCRQDLRIGVLGTQNRMCNSTSQGPDNCSLLCCGRGFQSVVEHIEEDCNCKFVWCCQVKCDKCSRYTTNDVCN